MIWRWLRRVLTGLALLLVCLIGFVYFVVATEWGTNWLLARTEAYMPAELALDGVSGTLLSGLAVEKLHWRDTGVDAEINELFLRIGFRPLLTKHLAIEEISAQRVHVAANSSRTASPDTTQFAVNLPLKISVAAGEFYDVHIIADEQRVMLEQIEIIAAAEGEEISLGQLAVTSDWMTFDAKGYGRLSPPYDLDGDLQWSLHNVAALSWSGHLQVSGDASSYELSHVVSQPVVVETEGVIDIAGDGLMVDLLTQWQVLQLPLADGRELQSAGGDLSVSGGLDSYVVDGDALFRLDEWPEVTVDISGRGSSSQFDLENLRVDSEDLILNANGLVEWTDEHSRAESSLELDLRVDVISGTLMGNPLSGAVALQARNGKTTIDEIWLAVGANRIAGNGDLAPNIDVALEWEVPKIATLWSAATGQSQGDIRLQQRDENWLATVNATGQGLSWAAYSVDSAVMEGGFSTNSNSDTTLTMTGVKVGSIDFDSVLLSAVGVSDVHEIDFSVLADERQLKLHAEGGYQERTWSGKLTQLTFVDAQRSNWSMDSAADFRFGESEFDATFCLQDETSSGRICAKSALQNTGVGRIAANIESLPLAQLPISMLADEVDAAGTLSLELEGDWHDKLVNGSISARLDNATLSTVVEGEPLTAELEHATARATIVENLLDADVEMRFSSGGVATAEGRIDSILSQSSAVNVKAIIELDDLSFVPLLIPVVANTSGTINGNLDVSGSLSAPVFGGELRLAGGAFDAVNAGINVADINVQVSQNANGDLFLAGSAQSGSGNVSVIGESQIDAAGGLFASAAIKGDDFEFLRLPEWQAVASPDLRVTLDDRTAKIRGQLRVPAAKVSLITLPESAERISPDAIVHGREQAATTARRRFDIDVQAILGDNVALSGFGLETQLTGDLRLRGGAPEPFIGTGRIELQDGHYTAYGQELKIESGALLFSGPLTNPTLDIRATRKVNDVTAGLNLSGTPSDLRSTVFSEPVLSDAEALSYLIAGRPLAAATDQESSRVGQAAFALGLTGADKVIAQLQSKLGLDSLVLETGDDVGRIVAGRRVGGRLLVEYGYGLVDRLGTLLLRYQLNRRLVVETTTGTTNTLDVVYSVKKD